MVSLSENSEFAVEDIPNGDAISRHISWPHKFDPFSGVIWQNAFIFSAQSESAVWRKYAVLIEDVHHLGCAQQTQKHAVQPGINFLYKGALTCLAGQIRAVSILGGFGFSVVHDPSGGQGIQHAEIRRKNPANSKPSKNQRADLLTQLIKVWGAFEPHECSAQLEFKSALHA